MLTVRVPFGLGRLRILALLAVWNMTLGLVRVHAAELLLSFEPFPFTYQSFTLTATWTGKDAIDAWWIMNLQYEGCFLETLPSCLNLQPNLSCDSHHAVWKLTCPVTTRYHWWVVAYHPGGPAQEAFTVRPVGLDPSRPDRPPSRPGRGPGPHEPEPGAGAPGPPSTDCAEGDPFNPREAFFYTTRVDYSLPGRGLDIAFSRSYDSKVHEVFNDSLHHWRWPLGYGWTHSYNIYLRPINGAEEADKDTLILYQGDGSRMHFFQHDDTTWRADLGRHGFLLKTGDTWRLRWGDGVVYHFNTDDRVDTIYDQNGNKTTLTYDQNDNLTKITDSMGREAQLTYDDHLLRWLYEPPGPTSGRSFEYRYCEINGTTGWYRYGLAQVLRHAPSPGADSLIVLYRYYYDSKYHMRTRAALGGLYTISDTSWEANRLRDDRLSLWYDDQHRLIYMESVEGDGDDNLSNDRVVYRAFAEYFRAPEGHPGYLQGLVDSTKVYYYKGPASVGSHDPADTSFHPAPPTSDYYVKTVRFDELSDDYGYADRVWERTEDPATQTSFTVNYGPYGNDHNTSLVVDPDGDTTKYEYQTYELCGETRYEPIPTKVTYPNGDSVRAHYSTHDLTNPVLFLADSTVDELNRRTDYFYDARCNLDSMRYYQRILAGYAQPQNVVTDYTYNEKGNLVQTEDPNGHITKFHYEPNDTGAYVTETRVDIGTNGDDDQDLVTRYKYNEQIGRIDTLVYFHDFPSDSHYVSYTHDVLNRLRTTSYPSGSQEELTYDKRGNLINKLVTLEDVVFYKIEYEYDALNHLTKVKEYDGAYSASYDSTVYAYSQHGEIIQFVNANNTTDTSTAIDYSYDADRLLKVSYPDGTSDSLVYYPGGNLKVKLDRKGQVLEYFYDDGCSQCGSRGWLSKKRYFTSMAQYPGNPSDSVVFAYDAVGNDTLMIDWNGEVRSHYDGLDRLDTLSSYGKAKHEYQYNLVGNRTLLRVSDLTNPANIYLEQTYPIYDEANRLRKTVVGTGNYDLTYWDTGGLKAVYYPNGSREEYALTSRSFIQDVATISPDITPAPLFAAHYTYNPLGDRSSVELTITPPSGPPVIGTISYSYDDLRRLKKAVYPPTLYGGKTVGYSYDPVGNRTEKEVDAAKTQYTYDKRNNHLLTAGYVEYFYDANGNLTQKVPPTERNYYYSYDFENRLTKVRATAPGADSLLLTYCGLGKRLKKAGTVDTTSYVYDGMYAVCEFDESENLKARYVYANGLLLGRIDADGAKYYYHHDGLGSIMGLTDEADDAVQAYLYDEFGNTIDSWGDVANHYLYTCQERDSEIPGAELYNLRARYCDSEIGRFISEDPELQVDESGRGGIGGIFPSWLAYQTSPQQLNAYPYVANNPVKLTDPTGRLACCTYAGFSASGAGGYGGAMGVGWYWCRDECGRFVNGSYNYMCSGPGLGFSLPISVGPFRCCKEHLSELIGDGLTFDVVVLPFVTYVRGCRPKLLGGWGLSGPLGVMGGYMSCTMNLGLGPLR